MPQKAKTDPITAELVNAELREIGRMELNLQRVEADLNEAVDKARSRFSPLIERRRLALAERLKALRLRCEDSREDLLPKGRKSLAVLFGTIGFRTQGAKVKTLKGVSSEDAARLLLARGCEELVRRRPEVDKATIADDCSSSVRIDCMFRRTDPARTGNVMICSFA